MSFHMVAIVFRRITACLYGHVLLDACMDHFPLSAMTTHVSQPVHKNLWKTLCNTLQTQPSRTYRGWHSEMSTSYLCFVVYSLLAYNPSRPCLTPECKYKLNKSLCLSYSYIDEPNMPSIYFKFQSRCTNAQTPDFLNLVLHNNQYCWSAINTAAADASYAQGQGTSNHPTTTITERYTSYWRSILLR